MRPSARRPLAAALATLATLAACAAPDAPSTRAAPAADAAPVWPPARGLERKRLEFAILEDYDKGASLDSVAADFRRFRALGIPTWRGSFGWDDYEPAPGRLDLDWLRRFVALARREGIALRPYLGYTPEWAAVGRRADGQVWNDPPRDPAAFARYAGAVAALLRDEPHVRSLELYNEQNVSLWWDGSVAEYADVFARGAAAVRAAHPTLPILPGGLVWADAPWAEATCEAHGNGARMAAVPVHVYAETWTPDSVTVETFLGERFVREFLPAIDAACGAGKPVWINETGFATSRGRTERDQAAWWARAIATFAATPRVTHVGVYEIKDLPTSSAVIGDAENYHLGLVRRDGTPKLAFATVQRLVALLAGELAVADAQLTVADVAAAPPGAPPVDAHLFLRPDGRQVLVAWVRKGRAARTVRVTLPRGGAARAWRFDGAPAAAPPLAGRTLGPLRLEPDAPVIVEVRP